MIFADFNQGVGLGARVGQLYAVNTGGAVLGAAFSGFVLLPNIGLMRSLLVAASLNLIVGFLVLVWYGVAGQRDRSPKEDGATLSVHWSRQRRMVYTIPLI